MEVLQPGLLADLPVLTYAPGRVATLRQQTRWRKAFQSAASKLAVGVIAALACSGCNSRSEKLSPSPPPASAAPEPAGEIRPRGPTSDASVVAEQVDGIWVFFHAETPAAKGVKRASFQARNEGSASIAGGCLYVDKQIVVWGRLRADEVRATVSDVSSGKRVIIRMSGAGRTIREGATQNDFPKVITEHCPTTSIWWASRLDRAEDFARKR